MTPQGFFVQVAVSLPADKFGEWEAKAFAPEAEFIASLGKIDGVSAVETQTFTYMIM